MHMMLLGSKAAAPFTAADFRRVRDSADAYQGNPASIVKCTSEEREEKEVGTIVA